MKIAGLKHKMIVLTSLIWIGFGTLNVAHALEIRINEQAAVRDDTIFLKDIASFTPIQDARIAQLNHVEIAAAPPPGKTFRIHDRFLIRTLNSAIAAIPNNQDIFVKLPDSLTVKRTAQIITSEQLKTIYKEYVFSHSPWPANRITFDRINDPGSVSLPTGKLRWKVLERKNHDFIGNMSITVCLWVDGTLIRKVPVSGRIMVKQDVIKATQKIEVGHIITDKDLVMVQEDHMRPQNHLITNLKDIIGMRPVSRIQAGQQITSGMIETPPVVEKGNRVIIRAENHEIKLITLGHVLEDGRAGDQIRVKNISSGKEIIATVVGPGEVEVYF